MFNFVNTGVDEQILKSVSYNKSGLVQRTVAVQGRTGTFYRKQWVSPQQVTMNDFHRKPYQQVDNSKVKSLYFPLVDCNKNVSRCFHYDEVVKFHKDNHIKQPLASWIKDNYFVGNEDSRTNIFYKKNGEYAKYRQQLHDDIVNKILDSAGEPKTGEQPVAVLMGGGSASGKGTIRNTKIIPNLNSDGINIGVVDCDEIKEELPEYSEFEKHGIKNGASITHDESMDIANQAFHELIKNKKHLLFDATMKQPDKYKEMITELKNAGYEVRIIGVEIDQSVALDRAHDRAIKTGREVPDWAVTSSNNGFAGTYPQLIPLVDKYELYDTSGTEPILVQDNTGIHNSESYKRFLTKGKENQIHRAIKQLSQAYDQSYTKMRELYDAGVSIKELQEYLDSGFSINDL